MPSTWILVGASRGIGLEFVRQLLERGDQVIAAVRNEQTASQLWQLAATQPRPASCLIEQCDVTRDDSIDVGLHIGNLRNLAAGGFPSTVETSNLLLQAFVGRVGKSVQKGMRFDNIVLNAGKLKYPNRATEVSFSDFALHLHTNTIGPIICARKLLELQPESPPSKVIFMSSDSGSALAFRDHEDGFGAYAASKAALNQMLRHMAVEVKKRGGKWDDVCVLALHPGEVQTDMANIDLGWEVEGIIQPDESVKGMLQVIDSKGKDDTGTFWCWDGRSHPW